MLQLNAGSTDQSIDIFIPDSSSTSGEGLDGLVYNSAGLTCYFRRGHTGTLTALTLATLATVGTAHADGGFKEIDATNAPGLYRLDLSDAMVAAGVEYLTIYLRGATNMAPVIVRVNLTDNVSLTDITDFFDTDTYAEVGSLTTGTATIVQMLQEIHAFTRQKIRQNNNTLEQEIYKRDGTTVLGTGGITHPSSGITVRDLIDP